ncbi:type II and III secretion system protein family protein [Sphingomonas sp. MS122]|uniref:type II and III secretion system protein family protein n=1 Tax=Sphingomonas sp. MS122 TaxID=3412683 RepID=UPI003C2AB558
MHLATILRRPMAATVAAALVLAGPVTPSFAQKGRSARIGEPAGSQRPTREIWLSVGEGERVTLPANVAEVWTSNPGVADVYVSNPRQINLFGKEAGEATVFATSASGAVVYSARVRVNQNVTSIDRVLKVAMPDADVTVTTVGQVAVLTGTVASPDDAATAHRLVASLLNPGVDLSSPNALLKMAVINRLKTATPLQVNLQVRIAEVSRSFVKNFGVNLASADSTGGFKFGIGQGRKFFEQYTPGGPLGVAEEASEGATAVTKATTGTSLFGAGKLFGLDILGGLDLGETIGQVTTLANPNLTALSGETGSFLAGGEIPIPVSQGLGAVSVEYKQYGVSLAYTPTVLSDGRISLRVRPEVSQLSAAGAVTIQGTQIPALTTRRAETTVELGSGQSLMIGGLLQNSHDNSIDKAPGLGDVPILGALFRSNGFRRNETELVIVITPYLVKPVNANQIRLPTDGYRAPTDVERVFLGQLETSKSGGQRPMPSMAPSAAATPSLGAVNPGAPGEQRQPQQPVATPAQPSLAPGKQGKRKKGADTPVPGFGFN